MAKGSAGDGFTLPPKLWQRRRRVGTSAAKGAQVNSTSTPKQLSHDPFPTLHRLLRRAAHGPRTRANTINSHRAGDAPRHRGRDGDEPRRGDFRRALRRPWRRARAFSPPAPGADAGGRAGRDAGRDDPADELRPGVAVPARLHRIPHAHADRRHPPEQRGVSRRTEPVFRDDRSADHRPARCGARPQLRAVWQRRHRRHGERDHARPGDAAVAGAGGRRQRVGRTGSDGEYRGAWRRLLPLRDGGQIPHDAR